LSQFDLRPPACPQDWNRTEQSCSS
jgi:hypothetical protein